MQAYATILATDAAADFLSPTSEITSNHFSRKRARVLIISFARSYCRSATKFLNQLLALDSRRQAQDFF